MSLESRNASQDAFIREAPRHRYLHVATHGYFAAERFKSALARSTHDGRGPGQELVSNQSLAGYHPGLLSGLALAGANNPTAEDDGILTAEEVGSLNLSNARLIVLSACETGLGQTAGGEGLLGLQRAFQAAGATTVIASLWKVDDVATRDLMERFYDNLWNKNMGKLEALREAQLWMLKERGPRGLTRIEGDREQGTGSRLPPYYWAAWVLSGDWR
jgi:CHAT domain-containing protein